LKNEKIKQLYEKGPIILYVGRRDPYKNILGLIDIFHQLLNYSPNASLVLAGPEDLRYPQIQEHIEKLGLRGNGKVLMTGYLSQDDLVRLYRSATVLVLPSFYEGFGLPILEAFSCGIPVVASRISSIPELVQDAGILLDPKNTDDWVQAIDQLIKNQDLREKFVKRGYERLEDFSWQKAVKQLLHQYEETFQK
jgi:glycosyltransferase involved in cell wall biosynthesis